MNENLYTHLSDQELLSLVLKIIDEYMLLSTTNNIQAIAEKREELFTIYDIIKERGLVFEHHSR
jgi:hypothetical protein